MFWLLSKLFPPKLGRVESSFGGVHGKEAEEFQGSIGQVQVRPYRDAIDRHFQTEAHS